MPFVVRTVQPILEDLDVEFEEAAASLGASRWQAFVRVWCSQPSIQPCLTGVALAFARGVGEYGSVIFIAGNIPLVSEITPLIIITKLEQYDIAGATAVAVVMLIVSFILLFVINALAGLDHPPHWQRELTRWRNLNTKPAPPPANRRGSGGPSSPFR